jgi:hypothetical protein
MMEDFDEVEDMEDLEDEAAANRRQFILLLSVFGGLLGVAIIVLLFIILTRNGAKSDIELTNEAVEATNAAVRTAVKETDVANAAIATADAGTAIAMATEKARPTETPIPTDTPTPSPTRTPTPVIASPTATTTPGEGGETAEQTPPAVALATGTRTPIATRGTSTTPNTGVGSLGAVIIAAVLVVVVLAARRLRMVT